MPQIASIRARHVKTMDEMPIEVGHSGGDAFGRFPCTAHHINQLVKHYRQLRLDAERSVESSTR
jgi:hypothetical protein